MRNTTKQLLLIGGLSACACQAQAFTLLDGFEDGDRDEYAVTRFVSNATVTRDAAHDGFYGVAFSTSPGGWHYRNDIVTSPGHIYRAYVYTLQLGSRFYLGVDAGPDGAIAAVFAPNSDTIEIGNYTNYDAVAPLASANYNIVGGTWYQLELVWRNDGQMAARLYEQFGTTPLADTGFTPVPDLDQGGLMFRGFTGTSAPLYADTITVRPIPEPTSLALLAGGALLLTQRRHRP